MDAILMEYLEAIDHNHPEFGDVYDELPLWSAPFGLLLLEHVQIKRGITILDVGAGTGFLSMELAQRCGSDALVIALDLWGSAITRLRRKLDALQIGNVHPVMGDAGKIPLSDRSVEVMVSNLGINNFEKPESALNECYRVGKPGGRLVLTTSLVGHMQAFYDIFRATLLDLGLEAQLTAFDEHVRHRGTVASVSEMLAQAGFEVTHVRTDTFRMRFADGSSFLRHHFIRLGFLPGWKAILPSGILRNAFSVLEQRLNRYASESGEVALTIPMACFDARK